jgi:hypothetical protein
MDHTTFDYFAKSLSAAGPRRGFVRLLLALPLGVTLSALLGEGPDATAKDDDHGSSHRHHRRRARNRHQSGNDQVNRKGKRKGTGNGKRKGKDRPDQQVDPAPPEGCPGGTVTCGSACFPECCPGTNESCYSGPQDAIGVGECQAGVRQCQGNGTWGACAGEVLPTAEACDNRDNDCDGVVDNGATCPTGMICQAGACTATCPDNTGPLACDCAALGHPCNHGCCTELCECFCDEGWTGTTCSELVDPPVCSDFVTCEACVSATAVSCVFCHGNPDACVAPGDCFDPYQTCPT